ncbi:MAG: GRP family sugar transporter [Nitrososphaerales archaeon]
MDLFGVMLALTAALVWGAGDFSGGLATRRSNQFQVLTLAALSGLVVLILFALLNREPFPAGRSAVLALVGGVAGAIGLAALYRGLAVGSAAVVAPVAGVLGAAVPVLYAAFMRGAPAPLRGVGFTLALAGIFLVSRSATDEGRHGQRGLLLAVLAGLGFGAFFILIAEASHTLVFTPLILARSVEFTVGLLGVAFSRLRVPSPRANPMALLAGVLDGAGNVFYVLAGQFVRLDVAAVIASFYPATTVVLSSLILKEKVSRRQSVGVVLCLAAIMLITV